MLKQWKQSSFNFVDVTFSFLKCNPDNTKHISLHYKLSPAFLSILSFRTVVTSIPSSWPCACHQASAPWICLFRTVRVNVSRHRVTFFTLAGSGLILIETCISTLLVYGWAEVHGMTVPFWVSIHCWSMYPYLLLFMAEQKSRVWQFLFWFSIHCWQTFGFCFLFAAIINIAYEHSRSGFRVDWYFILGVTPSTVL